MPTPRPDDLRTLTEKQLAEELEGSRRELMNLRFRKATMQLEDVTQVRKTRKKIARILTIMREHQLVER